MEAVIAVAVLVTVLVLNVTDKTQDDSVASEGGVELQDQIEHRAEDVSVCDRSRRQVIERDLPVPRAAAEAANDEQ